MNTKNVCPKQLCQALETALVMIGMDNDGAYLLADDCYSQFAARYASGFSEQLEQSGEDYTKAEQIEAVKILGAISLTPWDSFCGRILTALEKEEPTNEVDTFEAIIAYRE